MNAPERPDQVTARNPLLCAWCKQPLPPPKKASHRPLRIYCNPKCCQDASRAAHIRRADASPLRTDASRAVVDRLAAWKKKPRGADR